MLIRIKMRVKRTRSCVSFFCKNVSKIIPFQNIVHGNASFHVFGLQVHLQCTISIINCLHPHVLPALPRGLRYPLKLNFQPLSLCPDRSSDILYIRSDFLDRPKCNCISKLHPPCHFQSYEPGLLQKYENTLHHA